LEKAAVGERNVLQSSVINISSILSSITYAPAMPFQHYDYQCAKAALNMLTVLMAKDLDDTRIFIVLLHPGWVKTDMSGPEAPLTVEEASKNIVECILALKNEHHGKLINSDDGKKCTVIPF
jgi:NAD(P)-dependent dehydrogenase (short-subunit alcohol dehydrogenase family)